MKTLKKMWKQKELYLIVLPVLLYYLLFHYKPMYGLIIAFMDYSPRRGISGSTWVGLQHFMNFFQFFHPFPTGFALPRRTSLPPLLPPAAPGRTPEVSPLSYKYHQ